MPNLDKFYSMTGGWELTTDSVRVRQSPYALKHLGIDILDGVELRVENRPTEASYDETEASTMD